MAITITKAKVKAKAKTAANVIDSIVHNYVQAKQELEAKLAKLAVLQAQVAEGEKALLEYADMLVAPDEGTVLQAGDYVVKIGARGRKAIAFDNAAIKSELGDQLFDTLAQFNVTELKKYMTGNAFDSAVTYAHVNKRKISVEEAKGA